MYFYFYFPWTFCGALVYTLGINYSLFLSRSWKRIKMGKFGFYSQLALRNTKHSKWSKTNPLRYRCPDSAALREKGCPPCTGAGSCNFPIRPPAMRWLRREKRRGYVKTGSSQGTGMATPRTKASANPRTVGRCICTQGSSWKTRNSWDGSSPSAFRKWNFSPEILVRAWQRISWEKAYWINTSEGIQTLQVIF